MFKNKLENNFLSGQDAEVVKQSRTEHENYEKLAETLRTNLKATITTKNLESLSKNTNAALAIISKSADKQTSLLESLNNKIGKILTLQASLAKQNQSRTTLRDSTIKNASKSSKFGGLLGSFYDDSRRSGVAKGAKGYDALAANLNQFAKVVKGIQEDQKKTTDNLSAYLLKSPETFSDLIEVKMNRVLSKHPIINVIRQQLIGAVSGTAGWFADVFKETFSDLSEPTSGLTSLFTPWKILSMAKNGKWLSEVKHSGMPLETIMSTLSAIHKNVWILNHKTLPELMGGAGGGKGAKIDAYERGFLRKFFENSGPKAKLAGGLGALGAGAGMMYGASGMLMNPLGIILQSKVIIPGIIKSVAGAMAGPLGLVFGTALVGSVGKKFIEDFASKFAKNMKEERRAKSKDKGQIVDTSEEHWFEKAYNAGVSGTITRKYREWFDSAALEKEDKAEAAQKDAENAEKIKTHILLGMNDDTVGRGIASFFNTKSGIFKFLTAGFEGIYGTLLSRQGVNWLESIDNSIRKDLPLQLKDIHKTLIDLLFMFNPRSEINRKLSSIASSSQQSFLTLVKINKSISEFATQVMDPTGSLISAITDSKTVISNKLDRLSTTINQKLSDIRSSLRSSKSPLIKSIDDVSVNIKDLSNKLIQNQTSSMTTPSNETLQDMLAASRDTWLGNKFETLDDSIVSILKYMKERWPMGGPNDGSSSGGPPKPNLIETKLQSGTIAFTIEGKSSEIRKIITRTGKIIESNMTLYDQLTLDERMELITKLGQQKRAKGGTTKAGTPYLVGEKGPELFIPDTNGFVVPHALPGSSSKENIVTILGDIRKSINIDLHGILTKITPMSELYNWKSGADRRDLFKAVRGDVSIDNPEAISLGEKKKNIFDDIIDTGIAAFKNMMPSSMLIGLITAAIGTAITDWLTGGGVRKILGGAYDTIKDLINGEFGKAYDDIKNTIKDFIKTAADEGKKAPPPSEQSKDLTQSGWSFGKFLLGQGMDKAITYPFRKVKGAYDTIKGMIPGMKSAPAIANELNAANNISKELGYFARAKNAIMESKYLSPIGTKIGNAKDWVTGLGAKAAGKASDAFQGIKAGIAETRLIKSLSGGWTSAKDWVGGLGGRAASGIGNIFQDVKGAVAGSRFVKPALEAFGGAKNWLAGSKWGSTLLNLGAKGAGAAGGTLGAAGRGLKFLGGGALKALGGPVSTMLAAYDLFKQAGATNKSMKDTYNSLSYENLKGMITGGDDKGLMENSANLIRNYAREKTMLLGGFAGHFTPLGAGGGASLATTAYDTASWAVDKATQGIANFTVGKLYGIQNAIENKAKDDTLDIIQAIVTFELDPDKVKELNPRQREILVNILRGYQEDTSNFETQKKFAQKVGGVAKYAVTRDQLIEQGIDKFKAAAKPPIEVKPLPVPEVPKNTTWYSSLSNLFGGVGSSESGSLGSTVIEGGKDLAERIAQLGLATAKSSNTMGKCATGVRKALQILNLGYKGAGSGYLTANEFETNPNFTEVTSQFPNPQSLINAPKGSIIVYDRSRDFALAKLNDPNGKTGWTHGHVAISIGNGMEASDHTQRIASSVKNLSAGRYGGYRVFFPTGGNGSPTSIGPIASPITTATGMPSSQSSQVNTSASGEFKKGQQADFLNSMLPYAQAESAKSGVPVDAILAQAALESGWGTKTTGNYNYFGIKANKGWKGPSVMSKTKEEVNGVMVPTMAAFRSYGSMGEGLSDHFSFLQGDLYKRARSAKTPEEYFDALQEAGYATDSEYAQKLRGTLNSVRKRIDTSSMYNMVPMVEGMKDFATNVKDDLSLKLTNLQNNETLINAPKQAYNKLRSLVPDNLTGKISDKYEKAKTYIQEQAKTLSDEVPTMIDTVKLSSDSILSVLKKISDNLEKLDSDTLMEYLKEKKAVVINNNNPSTVISTKGGSTNVSMVTNGHRSSRSFVDDAIK